MKKNRDYYIDLPWSYTIEKESGLWIIHVNEMPGISTDNKNIVEGMKDIKMLIGEAIDIYLERGDEPPEPIDPHKFKGNIAYRTDKKRHYRIALVARRKHKSISKTMDELIDSGLEKMQRI